MPRSITLLAAFLLMAACQDGPRAADTLADGGDDGGPSELVDGGATDLVADGTREPELFATVTACAEVTLSGDTPSSGRFSIEGEVLVTQRRDEAGASILRAPAVVRSTTLLVFAEATGEVRRVRVDPSPTADPALLALGLTPDCPPFESGVASGDPTAVGVILWTRYSPDNGAVDETPTLTWELSDTVDFERVIRQGDVLVTAASDFTARVEVEGLEPGATTYYRFLAPDGSPSRTGRFRTAGVGAIARLRLALVSCSSLFSGYFNAYRRIAERDDLDLVLHLGDYIYDFVDEDEHVRIPTPFPQEPTDLVSHRARHALYTLDPDLRAARASVAFVVIWDNHDVEAGASPLHEGGVQAFREWVPMRLTDELQPSALWRKLTFGDLLDLHLVDVLLWKNRDPLPGSGAPDMLGTVQREWLEAGLRASRTTWRVIGNQKFFAPFLVPLDLGDSTWNGFPEARTRMLETLADPAVGDTVVLSGDAHFSTLADLPPDPMVGYDAATGAGSVAVEFLGGSLSRGNIDETVRGDATVYAGLTDAFRRLNPHFAFTNLIDHGWGLVELSPDRVVFQMRYSEILAPSDEERADLAYEVRRGEKHINRERVVGFE